jgi:hypothetical protein
MNILPFTFIFYYFRYLYKIDVLFLKTNEIFYCILFKEIIVELRKLFSEKFNFLEWGVVTRVKRGRSQQLFQLHSSDIIISNYEISYPITHGSALPVTILP